MAKLTCKVCGTKYDYCPNCDKYKDEPRWKITFCSENCKDIFDTLVKHTVGKFSTKEAQKALSKLDLSGKGGFDADIRDHIDSIMATSKNSEVTN